MLEKQTYAEAYAQHASFLNDIHLLEGLKISMPVLRVYDLSRELHRMNEAIKQAIEAKKNDTSIKIIDAIVAGRHVNQPNEEKHCDTKPKHWSVLDDVKFDFCHDEKHCHEQPSANKTIDTALLHDSLSHLMTEVLKPNTPRLDSYRKTYLLFLRGLYKAGWLSGKENIFVNICRFSQEYPTVFGLALIAKYRDVSHPYSVFGYHNTLVPCIRKIVFDNIRNYVYHVINPYEVADLITALPSIEITLSSKFRIPRYHEEQPSFTLDTFIGGMVRTLVDIVSYPNVVDGTSYYHESSKNAVDLLNILDYEIWMEETDKYQQL